MLLGLRALQRRGAGTAMAAAVRRRGLAGGTPKRGGAYGGYEPHMPSERLVNISLVMEVCMWLWVFHNVRHELPVLLGRRKKFVSADPEDSHVEVKFTPAAEDTFNPIDESYIVHAHHGHGHDHDDGHGHGH